MNIVRLEPETAVEFWGELLPYVTSALQQDPYNQITPTQIRKQVKQGFARVLVAADGDQLRGAALVTMNQNNSGERELHIATLSGSDVDEWLAELVVELKEIAQLEGADRITLSGRPGWGKMAHQYGFRVQHVNMALEVQADGQLRQQQQ